MVGLKCFRQAEKLSVVDKDPVLSGIIRVYIDSGIPEDSILLLPGVLPIDVRPITDKAESYWNV